MAILKVPTYPCDRCGKKKLKKTECPTRIRFGNYKYANPAALIKWKDLCKTCSNKLRKWMKE